MMSEYKVKEVLQYDKEQGKYNTWYLAPVGMSTKEIIEGIREIKRNKEMNK